MLRRRKDDVEGELPERSLKNYFVQLNGLQQEQYAEHEATVAQLAQLAKKRPLTKEQRQLLMLALACMRMACDTPYILDKKTRQSPKLDELEKLLEEWLADPACKIIVFSEWERMLTLLAERLNRSGIDYAWHTGSVTQKRPAAASTAISDCQRPVVYNRLGAKGALIPLILECFDRTGHWYNMLCQCPVRCIFQPFNDFSYFS